MITREELAGIVDALGAATFDEISAMIKELAYMKEREAPDEGEIKQLCDKAVKEHLIENVSSKMVTDAEDDETTYYILGPKAFPHIPAELSEVIDILELNEREIDMSRVTGMFSEKFIKWVDSLNRKIDSLPEEEDEDDIEKLENEYTELINLYYDFDFWLPDDISYIEDSILKVSTRLEAIRAA